jgi:hypothetical protein
MRSLLEDGMQGHSMHGSASLPHGTMHRREFLIGGARVGLSFLALDALALPAFAQAAAAPGSAVNAVNLTEPPANLDDSLNIMAAFLTEYQPPRQALPANGAWRVNYDLLEWIGTPRPQTPEMKIAYSRRNQVIGHMMVTRWPGVHDRTITYELDYAIELNGFLSRMEASMQCAAGAIPALTEWRALYGKHPDKAPEASVGLAEEGRCRDGILEIKSPAGTRRVATGRPVAPQWAVMDALRGKQADAVADVEFDLLQDLTSYRPRQRVRPCGVLEMSFGGRETTLHGFVQTGIGTEPVHYWVDGEGRPLLMTGGLLSCALTSIEPA